jgi:colanic acid/amylovoran biosynthesis glycosyltransferase
MEGNRNEPIACAHYLSKYLPLTENWIYRILINYQHFQPIVLSRKKANLELFPIEQLYCLEDHGKIRTLAEILFFRLSGYFSFFKTICIENNIRILHIHFGYHGVKSLGLKRKLNVPMICSFYGDDAFAYPYVGDNIKGYQRLFRDADMILVLGAYMRQQLIKLGCPESKITVHHLGIDVSKIRFEKRSVTPGKKIRFLIASSFVAKKGIDLALKALAGLKSMYDFSLDIIGDGPMKSELLSIIETNGMGNHVTLHGYKPYDYFINLAYSCDIFIQASKTTSENNKEGTPMAIVDAMATGLAVVSTKHSDIPEIVIDGENGFLAEENNLESLAESLKNILSYPDKIEQFSLKGRAWVEKEFDAGKQTLKLETYYNNLITTYRQNQQQR